MNPRHLRLPAALLVAALLAWVGYETVHAGSDIPPPPNGSGPTRLNQGVASGKRIDGRSWSLDYTTATMSQDGSSAEIDDVRDGVIRRNGKPFMSLRARHISADVAANAFTVRGPVHLTEIGERHRSLDTIGARYDGPSQVLHLERPTTIRDGALTVRVETAVVNFKTGDLTLGPLVGSK